MGSELLSGSGCSASGCEQQFGTGPSRGRHIAWLHLVTVWRAGAAAPPFLSPGLDGLLGSSFALILRQMERKWVSYWTPMKNMHLALQIRRTLRSPNSRGLSIVDFISTLADIWACFRQRSTSESLVWRFTFHFVYILSWTDKVHICILKTF